MSEGGREVGGAGVVYMCVCVCVCVCMCVTVRVGGTWVLVWGLRHACVCHFVLFDLACTNYAMIRSGD